MSQEEKEMLKDEESSEEKEMSKEESLEEEGMTKKERFKKLRSKYNKCHTSSSGDIDKPSTNANSVWNQQPLECPKFNIFEMFKDYKNNTYYQATFVPIGFNYCRNCNIWKKVSVENYCSDCYWYKRSV
jgi:hypothetical protein